MLFKSTIREIKDSFGRYMALLLIIALGVGFFAGLRVTDPAMRQAMQIYLDEHQFYDFRLVSSLGFEDQDIEYLKENIEARNVEESISFDILADFDGSSLALKAISIPSKINTLELETGHLPESDDECLIDSYVFAEAELGDYLVISDSNEEDDRDHFKYDRYKVVGTVKSPLFIQYERGTTSLGAGVLDGFMYITEDGFDSDVYTECYVKFDSDLTLYSDEYKDLIDTREEEIESILEKSAQMRYDRIMADANKELKEAEDELNDKKAEGQAELDDAKTKLDDAKAELDKAYDSIKEYEDMEVQLYDALSNMDQQLSQMEQALAYSPDQVDMNQYALLRQTYDENMAKYEMLHNNLVEARAKYEEGLAEYNDGLVEYKDGQAEFDEKIEEAEEKIADAKKDIADIDEPDTYLLGRDTNTGYVCFESDSTIVGAIAVVFPVFFFLVAALVCMTTMNRMVEDQRTQIGVLKALGYSNGAIMGKFIFYSGSAAFLGALFGFIAGTIAFPKAIWFAYKMMYNTNEISYYFSPSMLTISFLVAFLCSVGVTAISCRYEMHEMAASLMRPKAPKAGKRIFLEYIGFFWNRLKFLKKVSLRNIFRYKGRLVMMVMGIGGCTALLVAGLGIYDSIADIAVNQFTNISFYDIDLTMKDKVKDQVPLLEEMGFDTEDYLVYYHTSADLSNDKYTKNVYVNVYEDDANIEKFYDLHDIKGNHLDLPEQGKIIVNHGLADRYDIKVGDKVRLSSDSLKETEFEVAGINQNFISNYVYMTRSSYERLIGKLPDRKNIYLNVKEGQDPHVIGADLMGKSSVSLVSSTVDTLDRVDSMMASLNIIVYLVIGCAIALETVVVYNLTNINIGERVREIATVKVLGFYKEETRSYVFRENVILAVMGAAVGLVLGKYLHLYVMNQIVVDMITFDIRVTALSYFLAFILTILFTIVINALMGKKLDEISMTESLKAVE